MKEIGRSIVANPNIIEDELDVYLKYTGAKTSNAQATHTTEAQRRSREPYLSGILLRAADWNRADWRLLQGLKNDSLKEESTFTVTMGEELAMINNNSATESTPQVTNGY